MRIALVTYLPTHYRGPLFEKLADAIDADFYFTAPAVGRLCSENATRSETAGRPFPGLVIARSGESSSRPRFQEAVCVR
jgi:hypothetical protein